MTMTMEWGIARHKCGHDVRALTPGGGIQSLPYDCLDCAESKRPEPCVSRIGRPEGKWATGSGGSLLGSLAQPMSVVMFERYDSPDFKALLVTTIARLALALGRKKTPYVAFSGGKDSVAVHALCDLVTDGLIVAEWHDNELELPEIVGYMERLKAAAPERLIITAGNSEHAGWFRPWSEKPYFRPMLPGTIKSKLPTHDRMPAWGYDLTITGVRAEESRKRQDWLWGLYTRDAGFRTTATYQTRSGLGPRCCPIWDWTADDVWALIAGWGLAYCSAYDRLRRAGASRYEERIGPIPLMPREMLERGWPHMLATLEARYGERWA